MTPIGTRISACLIVRNEQSFLDGCLASLVGLVDEIVVVDTGSTDATIDIARRHGAILLEMPWRNDFAAARNFGLDAAAGDWILYIDADERLSAPSPQALRLGLDDSLAFAACPLFRPTVNGTLTREYRMFRNDPRLRFKGTMHETIRPDLDELAATIGAKTIDNQGMIEHLGYEGDLTVKHQRNLPLLRAAIVENPDRLYYWYDLAKTLAALGETDEAIDISSQGLALARRFPSSDPNLMGAMLALNNAGLRRERGEDVLATVDLGLAFHHSLKSLVFLRAQALMDLGRHEEAIGILDGLTAEDADQLCDLEVSYDRRLFGCFAYDLKGVALLRLGRRQEAARAFSEAAIAAPHEPSYRIKAMAVGAGYASGALI